jgi:1-deoxy-D-xylulose-5-phosphate reductoisomerase
MKDIIIIGSTGSIGTQTLELIRSRREEFQVVALSAGKNLDLLIDQIKEFSPQYVSITKLEDQNTLKEYFPDLEILASIRELAEIPVDIVISAVVGIAGLEANLAALKHSRRVAIANKETLVCAPHLVREASILNQSELIPIDSEHAAIHQCLNNQPIDKVAKILLTSSGGPFRTLQQSEFKNIRLQDALKHPKWSMGKKITIDSSTLMNKGLEVIEVNSLFDIDYEKIQVVIHPESIVHSAVSFVDGNTIAQLSNPDMMVPIQYAIDYPNKTNIKLKKDFDIFEHGILEFHKPDLEKFPALRLAYEAGRQGGSLTTTLNSANEAAVELFLEERIHYLDIIKIIEKELELAKKIENPSLEEILSIDSEIRDSIKLSS